MFWVYQDLVSFEVDEEGYCYQVFVFYIDQVVGIGICCQDDFIIDDDVEYVGYMIL